MNYIPIADKFMFGMLFIFTVLGQCLRLRFTNPRTLEALDVIVVYIVFIFHIII